MSLAYNTDISSMPALTTGHSHNADNVFEPFFGPISVQDSQNVRADSVFAHETYNLPAGRYFTLTTLITIAHN